jgi:hypothetical protein
VVFAYPTGWLSPPPALNGPRHLAYTAGNGLSYVHG